MEGRRLVYMDHAATTATAPAVVEAMLPYFTDHFGNPSSVYKIAREAKAAVDEAREKMARALSAKPEEIYFTSGGTEADNWAIKGIAFANKQKGNHIITSAIEHHAVLHTCQYLEKMGFEVTYLPVDEYGRVDPAAVEAAITDKTILISIMFANNEIGTIEPIAAIGALARKKGIYFHTDAVQAIGHVPIDVGAMQIDLLSLSGHKFNGPKGIGALYIRKGVKIDNFMHGGGQERKRRAGTENLAAIVGIGVAIERVTASMEQEAKRLIVLRDRLRDGILEKIPHARLNGHPTERLPGNMNISFEFIEGESILLFLDHAGISASTGSACTSGSLEPSHVMLAIGLPHELAHGSLRMTLGEENTEEEVDYLLGVLPGIVERLRTMSPLYADYKRSCNV
ncbi:cysteine desulfurase NifS [Methanosphaerula palustris]|uniref:Cysteine desulfurase IscS n=1 Tax=Methanosphaerula palustris (strain ATCC BAA-1556 / DSM 19958 / E1-9c) TaxID=521011 RepID=B8GK72_METPE|nr:cysteine desulfurase NifS [Methanosphaerula palustris]ACL17143.1 cysteine desulfurase NifS [Methanosphaerula palustris E1-9c]